MPFFVYIAITIISITFYLALLKSYLIIESNILIILSDTIYKLKTFVNIKQYIAYNLNWSYA